MNQQRFKALIVEDNQVYHTLIRRALGADGLPVDFEGATSAAAGLELARRTAFDVILVDYCLPGGDGLHLLQELRAASIHAPVIMTTGMGSEEIAVRAMKLGAFDYVVKSGQFVETVALAVRKALQVVRLERRVEEAENAQRRLEELDRLKSEFIAVVSHELRTPLVSIVGYADMLLGGVLGEVPDGQQRALEVVRRNGQRLKSLIEGLLLYAGLGASRRAPARRDFDLARAVADAVDVVRPECLKRQLRVLLSPAPEGILANADPGLIDEVLANLLANAVKFTPPGGEIRVTCRVDGAEAWVEVADTGCGIPAELQPHLFERFWQAETSLRRRYGGLGLGLAIIREILDRHRAPIRIDSREGLGTTVSFGLPLARSAGAERPERAGMGLAAASQLRPGRGRHVLAVDDDDDILHFLETLLGAAGYEVTTARSGVEALGFAERESFDLILLDVAMDGMDGITVLEELKRRETTQRTPVVMLTARVETDVRSEAMQRGAADFIQKPFIPDTLLSQIAGQIRAAETPA
ncbi:MAG: response regulator [Planctomycetes bacterium]|nr:response regulator [Planctomycetota bacterium]